MHFRCWALFVLSSIALGQGAPSSLPSPSALGTSSVGPNDPVITIRGLCDPPAGSRDTVTAGKAANSVAAKTPADCKTIITRAQFESLANALQPGMAPAMKNKLAELYPTMIVMSHTAQKRGYENSPQFKKLMEFSRIQVLSTQLNRAVQRESENVSSADLEKYYKENPAAFEQLSLQRIFVPKGKPPQPENDKRSDGAAEAVKSDGDAAKKEAESLQARAARGEDFDKLQKEAFDFAGLTTPAPSTMVKAAASEFSAAQHAVLDLKPDEVSHVLEERDAYLIYKLVSKEHRPLDDKSREDIKSTLAHQRFQSTMDQLHKDFVTTLSDAYFGSGSAQANSSNRRIPGPQPLPPAGVTSPTAGPVPASAGAPAASSAAKAQSAESGSLKPRAPQLAEPPK
jgi:PPIC-type PPIASE domain